MRDIPIIHHKTIAFPLCGRRSINLVPWQWVLRVLEFWRLHLCIVSWIFLRGLTKEKNTIPYRFSKLWICPWVIKTSPNKPRIAGLSASSNRLDAGPLGDHATSVQVAGQRRRQRSVGAGGIPRGKQPGG